MIEGIVDLDVDSCVSAFDRMGVLVEGADLDKIKGKVQNNFDLGKLKVKKKKMKMKNRGREEEPVPPKTASLATVESSVPAPATKKAAEKAGEEINDMEIMSFFTLPAEYAFVARALSQMDGVGKDLDPEFDFISAAAPHLVEIKGGGKYVEDEVEKFISKLGDKNPVQTFVEAFNDFRDDVGSFLRSQV